MQFPTIKLSYENIIHNKVCPKYNIQIAIPAGKKYFLWITHNLCRLVDKTFQIIQEYPVVCKTNQLGYIFYGTLFSIQSVSYFCIENIYYNHGYDVTMKNWGEKIFMWKEFLNHYSNILQQHFTIGLPIISYSDNHFKKSIYHSVYYLDKIEYRNLHESNISYSMFAYETNLQSPKLTYYFTISCDKMDDIYTFHDQYGQKKTLHISDYKTSVEMNRLFRYYKENYNLDSLEESDDEDEFQHPNIVFTDRQYKLPCIFVSNQWIPLFY
jgi:hypothetical protein